VFKADLLSRSDFAWQRIRRRLDGLTDVEYLWEPVPDCWTVRPIPTDQTAFQMDGSPVPPQPAPFTTIAWRVAHIIECLQAERTATWFGVAPEPGDGQPVVPGTAAGALEALDQAYAAWHRRVAAIDVGGLALPMGEVAQMYADQSRAAFVLHILDEVAHHGAEVCVLRDLYSAERLREPFVAACLRADRPQVEALRTNDPAVLDRARATHPDLVYTAASRLRWDAVRLLLDLGFQPNLADSEPGPSPLHYAAASGELSLTKRLVEQGADLARRDPIFDNAALGWAEYFHQDATASYLRSIS
jgi:DinB superfamily/Ankyrin repeats (many copies)